MNLNYFDKVIVVPPESDYGMVLFSDIQLLKNSSVLDGPLKKCNRILSFFHHVHFSFFLNKSFTLPFQKIWRKLYCFSEDVFESNKRYCVLFSDVSACRVDIGFLKRLSQKDNVTLCMYNVNLISKKQRLLLKRFPLFDILISFDKGDADKYQLFYYPLTYSNRNLQRCYDTKIPKSDAFFVGYNSGRIDKIEKVYTSIIEQGGKADFYVSGVKKNHKRVKGIHYNQWLSYSEVIDHVLNTNCLIEIVIDGEVGGTMRFQEALIFNKRFLTDNIQAKTSSLFNEKYMKIINDYHDVDIGFIKNGDVVDYHYENASSPIYLINFIEQKIIAKNKGEKYDN